MISSPDYLFVYGTLRRGFTNEYARFLQEGSKYVGTGSFPGMLYDLGGYPGAVSDPLCVGNVYGEVFNIAEHKRRTLALLDEYEGISSVKTKSEYIREEVIVQVDEQEIICWVYLYNWPLNDKQLIKSGDYRLR